MRLTNNGQRRVPAALVPDDSFEALRASFVERLQGERQRLWNLGAALAQGTVGRVLVLDELRNRAHRMSGTAAIFELSGVAALARALELAVDGMAAADRAQAPRAENSDRVMCAALEALIQLIDSLGRRARELRLHGPPAAPHQGRRILNG
jgi:HPt (histidine-containing phosphotransfer) domain-containing protein